MHLPQDYADVDAAREIAQKLFPYEKNITMIEHSADNIVALVATSFAVRFPRGKNAYLRSLYERHVLRRLESVESLSIPHVLNEHTNPPYVITSFVPGHLVSSTTIRTFSKEQQNVFSESVARFAYTMHMALKLDDELPLRKDLGLDELDEEEPWPVYFKRVIFDATFPTATQDSLAKYCYAEWVRLCDVAPTVVVHDDLHTENMMFQGDRLVGILDFGDTNVGTPEQELRQLYRISEDVMLFGVREYERLSGSQLNVEAVKLWAIMKELADYSKAYGAKKTSHHSFIRACHNLNVWLPQGEWGKGYDLSKTEGYQ